MAEKIKIVELDIDEKAFLKAAEATKIAIDKIVLSQKKLEAQGKKNSQEFIKNEANLKKLSAEFLNQKKAIIALESPYARLSNKLIRSRKEAKDLAVEFGVNSVQAQKAARSVNKLDKELKEIDGSLGQNQRSVGKYENALKGATAQFGKAALLATGFLAVISLIGKGIRDGIKLIFDFNKQLIAVGKTTNLSAIELARFSVEVIQLGREMKGISTINLLKTAEVAGQLGIRGSENILKFSATIEKLGLTSDIIGQDAARSFAKFIEVSSDSAENADRLGSVITQLGNNFATTEGEILKNTTEIQKGLAVYNTSAQSIIALGTATSALGSQSEASRGALQKVFGVLNAGVTTGENLEKILRLTGQTQAEFTEEFGKDATATFQRFVKGLSDASDRGENLTNTLNGLGLTQLRVSAVVGSLAKNYDVLESAMSQANDEYITNTALTIEAEAATKSLSSIVGDLEDEWNNLILSFENGSGVLSNTFKDITSGLTSFVSSLNDSFKASDSLLELFFNNATLFLSSTQKRVKAEADVRREEGQRKELVKELVELLIEENKQTDTKLDKQALLLAFKRTEADQLKASIEVIKNKQEAEKNAAKEAERAFNKEKEISDKKNELSEKEKEKLAKEAEKTKAKKEKEEADELKRLQSFEDKKRELQNQIELDNTIVEEEKKVLKATQDLETQLLELERINATETEKNELKKLLTTKFNQEIDNITEEATLKRAKDQAKFDVQDLKFEKQKAQTKIDIAQQLGSALVGLLGDSLGAQLAGIAFDAIIEVAKLKIATSAAQQINLANATAIAIPTAGASLIAAAATNVALGASSKLQQASILTSAAISGVGAIAGFYEGGTIGGEANIPTSMRNSGGDDVLIQAKRGEVILNEEHQARAGGSAFFNSIGVPGFANSGQVGVTSNVSSVGQQQSLNIEALGEVIASKLNDVQHVAIVDEIQDGLDTKIEIESGANI